MGYLKIIESNTTWVCPKTATYKIICVASGTPDKYLANNPTSFGAYCTAYGTWNCGHRDGYTLNSYGNISSITEAYSIIGYGSGVVSDGLLGKLKVSINDIKKDTNVVCTIGDSVVKGNVSSYPGVIVVQEIGDILEESIIDDESKKNEFTINLYRYDELYQTIKVKEGNSIVLPVLPLYNNDEIRGDVSHSGYTLSIGADKVYNTNQSIYPISDMNLYAGYSYKYPTYKSVSCGNEEKEVTAEYNGSCTLYVQSSTGLDHAPSGDFSFSINGKSVTAGTYYVTKGSKIKVVGSNSTELYGKIQYPVIEINKWRSSL